MSEETGKNTCECYKKLHLLGIPVFIEEESAEFGESNDILYEPAFELPQYIEIEGKIKQYPAIDENPLTNIFK